MSSKQHKTAARGRAAGARDIFQTVFDLGEFKTLTTALEAVGLARGLRSSGPYTLFAPTDRAFSRLAAGTLDGLLKPGSRDRLSSILRYHVVRGWLMCRDLERKVSLKTATGDWVKISRDSEGLKIDGALVVRRDLECSNGLIHVIDHVLLPNS